MAKPQFCSICHGFKHDSICPTLVRTVTAQARRDLAEQDSRKREVKKSA